MFDGFVHGIYIEGAHYPGKRPQTVRGSGRIMYDDVDDDDDDDDDEKNPCHF